MGTLRYCAESVLFELRQIGRASKREYIDDVADCRGGLRNAELALQGCDDRVVDEVLGLGSCEIFGVTDRTVTRYPRTGLLGRVSSTKVVLVVTTIVGEPYTT